MSWTLDFKSRQIVWALCPTDEHGPAWVLAQVVASDRDRLLVETVERFRFEVKENEVRS